jgi:hypothetical protein
VKRNEDAYYRSLFARKLTICIRCLTITIFEYIIVEKEYRNSAVKINTTNSLLSSWIVLHYPKRLTFAKNDSLTGSYLIPIIIVYSNCGNNRRLQVVDITNSPEKLNFRSSLWRSSKKPYMCSFDGSYYMINMTIKQATKKDAFYSRRLSYNISYVGLWRIFYRFKGRGFNAININHEIPDLVFQELTSSLLECWSVSRE